MSKPRVLFIDTETTGLLRPKGTSLNLQPRIIEFYGVLTNHKNKPIGEVDELIDPGIPLPPQITRITGITDRDLEGKPPFKKVAPKIIKLIRQADIVVAHNLTFDMEMVANDLSRCGIDKVEWPKRKVCTVEQTEHLKGHRLKLGDLYYHLFGETMKNAHRARDDAEAMRRCYFKLVKKGEL